jgi:hypothetical protein
MGNAKARGTYAERRRQAILAGRIRPDYKRPEPVKMPLLGDVIREATFARFPKLRELRRLSLFDTAMARWKKRNAVGA